MSVEDKIFELAETVGGISQKIDDLHGSLYRNGFRSDIGKIKDWITTFEKGRSETCPALIELRDNKARANTKSVRRTDVMIGIFMLIITIGVGVPAWVAILGG